MEYVTLGRTGLKVSAAGLGAGGASRLGQSHGRSFDHSVSIVRAAIDAGVNFIDTAAAYRTEEIVGAAIRPVRDQIVLSTKLGVVKPGTSALGDDYLTGSEFEQLAEANLKRLGVDYIDIFHLHGVMPDQYDYCRAELAPALERMRDKGQIRFLGLTERFIYDPGHAMLERAFKDDCWDVVMSGFNFINQTARSRVFPLTVKKNIGVLIMFAVRRALRDEATLLEVMQELATRNEIDPALLEADAPMDFLYEDGGPESLVEAAYRYCRHEPGADVVLTGTGSHEHLAQNIGSLKKSPLPENTLARLSEIFGRVESISGN
ncbi:MAG: aldo/keto reductase [Pseudomonadota bacterium]